MSDEATPAPGTIGWIDLTVEDAETVRDFYGKVVGWDAEPVDMGGYSDFTMTAPDSGQPAGGICHARGSNTGLPTQWMIYINVENLALAMKACTDNGGLIISGPKGSDTFGHYCIIRDPSGAAAALFQPPHE